MTMTTHFQISTGITDDSVAEEEARPVFDAKSIPGNPAIWVGIFSELTEFALFFVIYFLARAHYLEEFQTGPLNLHTVAGTINTVVLISSSYFLVKGIFSLRKGNAVKAIRWLWMTVACGGLYLLVKYMEFQWNYANGIETNTNHFYAVYYYTTFNHMLHVGWGSGGIIWAITQIKSGRFDAINHAGLIAAACYWHMIDLAWIMIFPLLYVLR